MKRISSVPGLGMSSSRWYLEVQFNAAAANPDVLIGGGAIAKREAEPHCLCVEFDNQIDIANGKYEMTS